MKESNQDPLIVAIDGPAGSGKSTVARMVAQRLQALLLDTGAIYRSLALLADRKGCPPDDGPALAKLARQMDVRFVRDGDQQRVQIGSEDVTDAIRTPRTSRAASIVSRHPEVRGALLDIQHGFARRGSVVAEGRDIGTVVFPRAQVKVFLVADPRVRAQRRFSELRAAGQSVSLEQVTQDQQRRDDADASRAVAPLKAAPDAVRIDTSELTPQQVCDRIMALCRAVAPRTVGT